MLIKDWEYWEDKLSMGHMALFGVVISFKVEQATFESELAAMAADSEIRNELKKIDQEFVVTEADGLENL